MHEINLLWRRIKCFRSALHLRNWKPNNQRSFWILLAGNSGKEIAWSSCNWSFSKRSVFKMFSVHILKANVSNFSGLISVSEKLRFRDGLMWTVALTVENKAVFSSCFGKVWMRPKKGDSCSRKLYLATFESKPSVCVQIVFFPFQWILWKSEISRGLGFQGLKVDYSMFLVKFFNLQTIQRTIKRNVKFLIFSKLPFSGNEKQEQMSRILLSRVKLKQLTGDCII